MTMPNERTRALIWAGEFLREIIIAEAASLSLDALKLQVKRISRHYPSLHEIESIAQQEETNSTNNDFLMLSTDEVNKALQKLHSKPC